VDVTTEKPAAFTRTTARALITYSRDKNGACMPAITGTSGVGGVALRDCFGDEDFTTKYSPAFIYHDRLGDNPDRIAYAVSHELGHNLGLSHDGPGPTLDPEGNDNGYYQGHGSGATSWAPIMGAGYGRSVVQWSKGEYRDANNHEDDLAIIEGKLGYRPGLAPASLSDATPLAPLENGRLGATSILRHAGDAHYYLINLGSSGYTDFTLNPARVSGTGSIIGNTDLKLDIVNINGIETASNNPAATTTASLNQWLSSGTSYVRISSTGAGAPLSTPPTGYTAYGSIGHYTLSTNLVHTRPSLASALNSSLTWTTEPGSVADWTGQTATTHDGVAAAQSGAVAYQADSSGIVTTVEGPGTVSFWWKCSGQATDELVFAMTNANGITSTGTYISGGVDWQQQTFTINTTGTHQFGWTFVRASPLGTPPSVTGHGWVDQVVWTPAAPFVFNTTPSAKEITPEAGQFALTIEATNTWTATTGADAPWLSATPASGAGDATLAIAHAANDTGRTRRGTVTITSAGINRVCEIAQPPAPPSLATALGGGLSWQTGGDSNWTGQIMTTHDGLHAARSGIIFGNQKTWLQTTVDGPGTLEFWWKVSSEEEDSEPGGEPWGDILRFHVDGAEHARTSGEKDWTLRAFTITGTGAHTLRWAYEKDPYASFGSDAAWLDQVVWTTGTAAPPMLSVSPDSRRVPDAGGQFTVAVSANVAWSAVPSVPWLAVSPSTGSNAATLTITYAANTSTVERAGAIKITGGGLTDTCTVTQAARVTGTTGDNNNNNNNNDNSGGGGGGGGAASLWLLSALALVFGIRSRKKSE
jgi:hypothetical protein